MAAASPLCADLELSTCQQQIARGAAAECVDQPPTADCYYLTDTDLFYKRTPQKALPGAAASICR